MSVVWTALAPADDVACAPVMRRRRSPSRDHRDCREPFRRLSIQQMSTRGNIRRRFGAE